MRDIKFFPPADVLLFVQYTGELFAFTAYYLMGEHTAIIFKESCRKKFFFFFMCCLDFSAIIGLLGGVAMFHILVVDDDKNTRRLLQAVLEAERYTVSTACDGDEALAVMDREHIDLVVLDIMMPNMDGYEFTSLLRRTNNDLPVLMVTAKQLPEDKKRGFLVGTDDYMTKPIDEEEMLLRIKALLRRAKIVSERRIVLGDVELNYDSMSVTRNGETQVLPQKEFLLLYKLLSYPGKTFTRIQLMDEIWGSESESGWETVTVHVGRLRKRFEDWNEFEIQSVRGLGYRAVRKE